MTRELTSGGASFQLARFSAKRTHQTRKLEARATARDRHYA